MVKLQHWKSYLYAINEYWRCSEFPFCLPVNTFLKFDCLSSLTTCRSFPNLINNCEYFSGFT